MSLPLPQVSISGENFVVNGQPYQFRGALIQFAGLESHRYGLPFATIGPEIFNWLQSHKVNFVRASLTMELASPSYGTWNEQFFTNLENLINLAEQYNVYLMVVPIMSYKMAPKFNGSGHPDWWFPSPPLVCNPDSYGFCTNFYGVNGALDIIYKAIVLDSTAYSIYDRIRESAIVYHQRIASICKDRNAVMAIDIYNEPEYRKAGAAGYSAANSVILLEKLASWIREIDTIKPLAVENNFVTSTKPNITHMFSSPHGYITAQVGDSISTLIGRLQGYPGIGSTNVWNVPVVNGEWRGPSVGTQDQSSPSITWTSATAVAYTRNYIAAMEQLKWNSSIIRQASVQLSDGNQHLASDSAIEQAYFDYFALNLPITPPQTFGLTIRSNVGTQVPFLITKP